MTGIMQVLLSGGSNGRYAMFAFGNTSSGSTVSSNTVGPLGNIVTSQTQSFLTSRQSGSASSYGGDKGIFALGYTGSNTLTNKTCLINNMGYFSNDSSSAATARWGNTGTSYGTDKSIFIFGNTSTVTGTISAMATVLTYNLVSNTGVVAADAAYSGTSQSLQGALSCTYGGDKGTFYGGMYYSASFPTVIQTTTNQVKVSNTGVLTAANTTPTNPWSVTNGAGAGYSTDKGIIGFGWQASSCLTYTSLVNNSGDPATFSTNVATARQRVAAASYGSGQAVFGFGTASTDALNMYASGANYSTFNLVSNTGVVATDTSTSALARQGVSGTVFS
jgi:hypothetical protein